MATFQEFMRVAKMTVQDKTSGERAREIIDVMRKYHVNEGLTPEKVVDILEALGPTYVKIGQLASSRSDILPPAYCKALEKLQANVAPMSYETVLQCIDEAYGKSWKTVFSEIEEKPLGAASIAQVHKATLLDGTPVAVKVRRPGIVQQMAEDITMMQHILAWGEFVVPSQESMMLNLESFVTELERTTANEVDFTIELHNLVRFHEDLKDQPGVNSPIPYPHISTESVLVMEYVQGSEVDELAEQYEVRTVSVSAESSFGSAAASASTEAPLDLSGIAKRLVRSYVVQVLDNGFFHADPHPGNIVIRGNEIVWIDLGMVGTLTAAQRSLVNQMFQAVTANNAYEMKEAVVALSRAHGEVDQGKLLMKMEELLRKYGSADFSDINIGALFEEVIEILRNQNLIVEPSVTMLARGVMTLEGVVAEIAPNTNVMTVVSNHVLKEQMSRKNIEGKLFSLAATSAESAQAMAKLPRQISDTLEMIDRGDVKVIGDVRVEDKTLATLYALAGRLSLAIIAVGLFLGSSILCTTDMQPRFMDVPLLGVFGFIGAFILSVYVIVRVMQSRHEMVNNKQLK